MDATAAEQRHAERLERTELRRLVKEALDIFEGDKTGIDLAVAASDFRIKARKVLGVSE